MKTITTTLLLFITIVALAQDKEALKNPKAICQEMVDLISIEPGQEPDYNAFRNLFIETARFNILNQDPEFPMAIESVSLDEFIEILHDPYYQKGFTETQLAIRVDEFNGIAQAFQSYEGMDGEGSTDRGINSIQMAYSDGRWWIVNVLWTSATEDVEIPKKYMKSR